MGARITSGAADLPAPLGATTVEPTATDGSDVLTRGASLPAAVGDGRAARVEVFGDVDRVPNTAARGLPVEKWMEVGLDAVVFTMLLSSPSGVLRLREDVGDGNARKDDSSPRRVGEEAFVGELEPGEAKED